LSKMNKDISEILLDENRLEQITVDISEQINSDYKGKSILIVGVLKGSFIFLADLMKKITADCTLDFIAVSSYGASTESSGHIRLTKDFSEDLTDRHVLIVEDILDTGNTLSYVKEYIFRKGAASVKICTLLDKPSRRTKPIYADYAGAVIEDFFVVGYGLDYDERYRNLPYVGILKEEVYQNQNKTKE